MSEFYHHCLHKCAIRLRLLAVVALIVSTAGVLPGKAENSPLQPQPLLTLKVTQTTVKEFFALVESRSKYAFIYADDVQPLLSQRVSVNVSSATIEQTLDAALRDTGLSYSVKEERQIIITRKHKTSSASTYAADPRVALKKVEVSGQILDEAGKPVAGATVFVKDNPTLGGVLTDMHGRFVFNVPEGSTLRVSYLGYNQHDIEIAGGGEKKPLTARLTPSEMRLEDVVVVGYGTQRKESVVGAISQIDNSALVNSGNANISNAMVGKLSGVSSYQTSGQPGSNTATLLIRGISSWNGSSPLVLVDGIERSISDLDPNEIQTISVLKDASATAVFGAKGANGVIIVTTQTGSEGRPKMKLSVDVGVDIPTDIPEHISSYQTGQIFNIAMKNEGSFGKLYSEQVLEEYRHPSSAVNSIRYPDNDWFALFMKKCTSNVKANYSISGGSERVKYYVSLGYSHEGSIIKRMQAWDNMDYSFNRINYRSNLDFKLSKSTTLAVKLGGALGIQQEPNVVSVSDLTNMFYSTSPMSYPAYFPSWFLEAVPDDNYPGDTSPRLSEPEIETYYNNPYTQMSATNFEQTTRNRLYSDAIFTQKLDFITKGLSLKAKVSLNSYFNRVSQKAEMKVSSYPKYYIDWTAYDNGENPWIRKGGSEAVLEIPPFSVSQGSLSGYYNTFYWEGSVNYDRKFGRHNVSALVLFNQREYINKTEFAYRTQGVVGRINYDFGHKYLLEANLGYTGSEQFSPKNRYGLFPSVAVGYVLSQEKFWRDAMPWWSKMKLRYSDGLVGNDQTDQRWLYYSQYSKLTSKTYVNIVEDSAANTDAKWETARKRDLGIEMGWLSNMITLQVELFDEHRKDMLISPVVPLLVGTTYKAVNRGEIKKHGIEVELGLNHKTSYGLRYNLSAMVGFNENRVIEYGDLPYAPDYQKMAGKAYGGMRNGTKQVDSGYYTSIDDIHNYPTFGANWANMFPGLYKYLDYNVDGVFDSDDMHPIEGTKYAPVTYSFNGGLSYKGFEFSVMFFGNEGKFVEYKRGFEVEFNKDEYRVNKSQVDYWRPDHQNATHSAPSAATSQYSWGGGAAHTSFSLCIPEHTWRSADFLTLKELYAAYTINNKKLKKSVGINSLSVSLTANNLFTVTDLLEGNPNAMTFTSGFYPMMTTLKLGVKIGF